MAPFSNIQSSWADQYGSIDTWNIKIRPLVIILWHNILVHKQGALNSLLTTIANRNYSANRSGLIMQKKIRKFAQNRHTHKHTNRQRIQLQRPLLSPVDRRGERANTLSFRIFPRWKVFVWNPELSNFHESILSFQCMCRV